CRTINTPGDEQGYSKPYYCPKIKSTFMMHHHLPLLKLKPNRHHVHNKYTATPAPLRPLYADISFNADQRVKEIPI
ncbi:hypothetical protein KA005_20555, partial [bacterium]|nr:hypothetical protein [bacterium]